MTRLKFGRSWQHLVLPAVVSLFWGCTASYDGNTFVGYVEGEYIYVSSPQPGWLVSTPFVEGDTVRVGDVLFELDTELEKLQVEEAMGRSRQSRAQLDNLETGARPAEIAALQAKLEEAEA